MLDRILENFRFRVEKVYGCDDFSTDDTYLIGLGYSQTRDGLPITMVRQPRNLGYGGNHKPGYRMAIDDGMDVVVLLQGDARFENLMLGTEMSEFHSGHRAYSTKALASIDVEHNSDDFDFDTGIIIQLVEAGLRIKEIPIPTYYGDEICRVNGMKYAADVATDVVTWRLNKMGLPVPRQGRTGLTGA